VGIASPRFPFRSFASLYPGSTISRKAFPLGRTCSPFIHIWRFRWIQKKEKKDMMTISTTEEALGSHISKFNWSHFMVLTFQEHFNPNIERCKGEFRKFIRRVEGQNEKKVYWYYALEKKDCSPPHIHCLLGNCQIPIRDVRKLWRDGHSYVRLFDPTLGGVWYVTGLQRKHTLDWDWHLSDKIKRSTMEVTT
jgi:hypothetical protein